MNPRGDTPTGLAGRRPTRLGDPGTPSHEGEQLISVEGVLSILSRAALWRVVLVTVRTPCGRLGRC